MMTRYCMMESPVGPLMLTSDGTSLTGIFMGEHRHGPSIGSGWIEDPTYAPLPEAVQQLTEFFKGRRREFDLPLAAEGTPFQRRVWEELCRIPYGETISYGELARRIGQPNASRAVGLANGWNPLSIVVPCHRVIGANGKLTGYGGGLSRKEILLRLESPQKAGGLFG